MIGLLDADPAGAESLSHVHGEAIGVWSDDESQAVVAIDCGGAGCGTQHLNLWLEINAAQGEHVEIAAQACDAMGIDAAQVRGSENFSGLGRILLGNSEMEKRALAEIAQRFDGENFGLHFSHVFFAFSASLRRQGLPAGFRAKRNEEQTNGEGDGRQRDGNSQRLKMLNAGADQKGDPRSAKSSKGRGKCESARPAFRRILLWQPERVNRKIRAAKTQKEKAKKEPGKRRRAEIENFSKRERDERQHQREKKSQGSAPAEFFREPRHGQAAQNRRKRNQHGGPRSELRRRRSNPPRRFRKHRHRGRNVHRSRPEAANGSQHVKGIQNRSAAHSARKKYREWMPDPPGANDSFFLPPALRLGYAVTDPRQQ